MKKPSFDPRRSISRRVFLAAAGAGAACVTAGVPLRHARAAGPLRVGILLPRSGHLALIGQACQRGAEVAVPMLADMGSAVELVSADTESNPDVGRTQAEKLIREGIDVLVGCFDSGTTAAVAQVAEQKGMPFVINIAANPAITKQGYKYVFRNFPTGGMLVTGGLTMMNKLFEATGTTPKTAVMMHVNDTFGTAMLNGIKALAPKVGIPFEIKEYIAYDPKAKDMSVEVAKAKAQNPDILMVVSRLNDAILMVREMVKQRFEPMGIISPGSPGMYEQQFSTALGKYAEYCITNVPWFNPTQPMTAELRERFTKAYPDETFELNVGFTFEAILIAADAAKRAGGVQSEALVEALRTTDIKEHVMTGGPIKFSEEGQNVDIVSAAVQNRNGGMAVVLPADIATEKPVFPMPKWTERG
jgi:branched-chain amino acid transport system substrate-binding protein